MAKLDHPTAPQRSGEQTVRSKNRGSLRKGLAVAAVAGALTGQFAVGQVSVLPPGDLAGFEFIGEEFATAEVVSVSGVPFSEAFRITVFETPPGPWQVQLLSPTIASISARDALVAVAWVRRVDSESERGLVDLVVEQGAEPFARSLSEPLTPTSDWRRIAIPLLAFEDYGPGEAKYDFQFGHQEQVLEIGGFELVDYGSLGVLGADSVDLFNLSTGGLGSGEIVPVTGQLFDRAWRVATTIQPDNPWEVQLGVTVGAELSVGETTALVFSYRDTLGSGAAVSPVFEFEGDPYTQSFRSTVPGDTTWQRVVVPFEVSGVSPNGNYALRFQLGRRVQEVEIGGIELLDFGTSLGAAELTSSLPYPDRSPLAPWRERAEQRIRRNRMAELRVRVGDLGSNPLSGATIDVRLKRHSFGFGTAIAGFRLLSGSPDDLTYQDEVRAHFNMAVSENFLKWQPWESQPKSFAVDVVDWLEGEGLRVRGHNLVWPSWNFTPPDVPNLFGDDLRNRVLDHIEEETTYPGIAGRIEEWDVVNEAFTNHDIQDQLNDDTVLEDWMAAARVNAPDAKLYLNDFAILTDGGGSAKEDFYFDLISGYRDRGVPIDGMGFQSHFQYGLTSMDDVFSILDRFASLGLRLSVTEFDQNVYDPLLQADYLEDFTTLIFSHPNVDSFLMWGFWDGSHWLGNAPIYRTDWSLKPSGAAWFNLVENLWHTEASGATDALGRYRVDGFLGEYTISATYQGVTEEITATLEPGGTTVVIRIDPAP